MPRRKPKKPRAEWPYLVKMMAQRGTGILRVSVAKWSISEGSVGRPFIRFALEGVDGNIYRLFLYPQQEKYGPKPEVLEECMVEYEEMMQEKKEAALAKKAKDEAYRMTLKERAEALLK